MSIASEIQRLQQAKADLKTAIEAKGVTVPAATTLDGYAALVDQIQQGGGSLPYDAEIEYLMTDGSAYIDTGIQGKCAFEIIGGINRSNSAAAGLFGSRTDSTSNAFCLIWYGDASSAHGLLRFDMGSGTGQQVQNAISPVANDAVLKYNLSAFKAGSSSVTPALNSQEPTSVNHYLFGVNTNGVLSAIRNGTYVKSAKIGKEGLTVRDYIPVRVGTVGYLYDKISGQLFGNAGTGDFILGNDVNV